MGKSAGDTPGHGVSQVFRERYIAHPRHGPLPALLILLSTVTGIVDAVSILRLDRVFVANMTGNVVFVGFGVAGAEGFSIRASLTALAGFVVGATAHAWLPSSWRSDRAVLLRTAAVVKLTVALPVVLAAAVVSVGPGHPVTYALIAALAASMGVQNATVRKLAVPDLTTTVFTLTLTGLFTDLRTQGWRDPAAGYRAFSVLFLFAGAVVGATLVLDVNIAAALSLAAVIIAVVGLVANRAASGGAGWVALPRT